MNPNKENQNNKSKNKKINLCLNPDCLHQNLVKAQICEHCNCKLLLKERYRPIKLIGQGGFGKTFLAVDEGKPSKPYCVIKQFFPKGQKPSALKKAAELFEKEAMRLEQLGKHPQIPELIAYFNENNKQYLVQEYIDGDNLAEELKNKGRFNENKIKVFLLDLLNILKFIHKNKIIHRDIKPENIIRRKQDGKVVLVDFGAAKVATEKEFGQEGDLAIGSAEYIPPEQKAGNAIYASDLYSLGVTCINLLTKKSPFDLYDDHENKWIWKRYLEEEQISFRLGKIIDKLVSTIPKKRYKSSQEVLEELDPSREPSPEDQIQFQKITFEIAILEQQKAGLFGLGTKLICNYSTGKAKSYLEHLKNGHIIEMIKIPGGNFQMGSPDTEDQQCQRESPQHWVTIAPFCMSKYPITQEQWLEVAKLPKIKLNLNPKPSYFEGENLPVEQISWFEAMEFCYRLSKKSGMTYTLPTEAQWEYACRAGTNTEFHFGSNITTDLANYNGTSYKGAPKGKDRQQTTPVDSFYANPFGLYDLHGNVWEWCADYWHDNYKDAPTDGSAWLSGANPKTPRVVRGGSWYFFPRDCRSSNREFMSSEVQDFNFGFRIVRLME